MLYHTDAEIVRSFVQELTKAITKVTDMDADMSVEMIEINPSNVAQSMSTGTKEETIEIPTSKTKKTKKKSKREAVPQLA